MAANPYQSPLTASQLQASKFPHPLLRWLLFATLVAWIVTAGMFYWVAEDMLNGGVPGPKLGGIFLSNIAFLASLVIAGTTSISLVAAAFVSGLFRRN